MSAPSAGLPLQGVKIWDEWDVEDFEVEVEMTPSAAASRESWLREMGTLSGSYGGKLLRRHVPPLPDTSLQELIRATASARNDFLSRCSHQTAAS